MSEQALQTISRDIETITGEIKEIQSRAQSLALMYAVEIGRRLKEAKEILPHGEWGKWLSEKVEFSQKTAERLVKAFNEFGAENSSSYLLFSNSTHVSNLPYSKALQLLAVPAEEREEFVQQNDVAAMSREELDRVIKERDEARADAENARKELFDGRQTIEDAKALIDEANALKESSIEKVNEAREAAQAAEERAQASELKAAKAAADAKAEAKAKQQKAIDAAVKKALKEQKETLETTEKALTEVKEQLAGLEKKAEEAEAQADAAAAKAREETQQQAEEERKALQMRITGLERKLKTAGDPKVQKFGVYFEQLQTTFAAVFEIVNTIEDPDLAERFKYALCELLRKFEADLGGDEAS